MKRNLLLLIGLAVAVIAVAVFGMDHSRVVVARGDLQNQVNRVAGEARERIGANAVLAIELTGPDGSVRTVDLEVPAEDLTGDLLAQQTPMDSLLTGVQMNAVRVVPPEPQTVSVESKWFREGTVSTQVERTETGATVRATGTAKAGIFGRTVTATATLEMDGTAVKQDVETILREAVQEAARQVAQRKTSFPVKVVVQGEPTEPQPAEEPSDEIAKPGESVKQPSASAGEPEPAVTPGPESNPVVTVDPDEVITIPESSSGTTHFTGVERDEAMQRRADLEREELERELRKMGVIP